MKARSRCRRLDEIKRWRSLSKRRHIQFLPLSLLIPFPLLNKDTNKPFQLAPSSHPTSKEDEMGIILETLRQPLRISPPRLRLASLLPHTSSTSNSTATVGDDSTFMILSQTRIHFGGGVHELREDLNGLELIAKPDQDDWKYYSSSTSSPSRSHAHFERLLRDASEISVA